MWPKSDLSSPQHSPLHFKTIGLLWDTMAPPSGATRQQRSISCDKGTSNVPQLVLNIALILEAWPLSVTGKSWLFLTDFALFKSNMAHLEHKTWHSFRVWVKRKRYMVFSCYFLNKVAMLCYFFKANEQKMEKWG